MRNYVAILYSDDLFAILPSLVVLFYITKKNLIVYTYTKIPMYYAEAHLLKKVTRI